MYDITLCALDCSFADVKTRKQLKENVYKRMTAEDRKEMAEQAEKAQNPILKKRLETRAVESELVDQKMEVQKRREAASAKRAPKLTAILNNKRTR